MPFDPSRYTVLVDSVAEGVIVYDDRGRIALINDHALGLLGLTRAQMEGREPVAPAASAVNLDEDPISLDDLAARVTLRTGRAHELVSGIDRPGQARVWLSSRSAPLEGGGAVVTLRDASDAKLVHDLDRAVLDLATTAVDAPAGHVDDLLRHALAIMGRATDADRVVLVAIDRTQGRAAATHDWAADGTALTRREGGVPLDLIPRLLGRLNRRETIVIEHPDQIPADSDVPRAFLEMWGLEAAVVVPVMDGGVLVGFCVIGWRPSRSLREEIIRFTTIAAGLLGSIHARDRADAELRVLNESLDERVRARSAELADEQERTSALIAALPDLMFELDRDGVFLTVHVPEDSTLEPPPEPLIGKRAHDVLPADLADEVEETLARVRRSGSMEILEYSVPVDDVVRTFDCRVVPRRDGGFLAVIRDVSGEAAQARSQREQAARLARANEELERAVQAKDEFLASISHELRTPMTAILGLSEMLLDEASGPLTDAQRSALTTLDMSARHLLELINDLLDLDRLQRGVTALDLAEVPAGEVGREAIELVGATAERRGVRLELIDGSHGAAVLADGRRLRQILLNLLDNAIKFTNPGGAVGLQIWRRGTDRISFAVWDTGVGIEPEDQIRIFEPFTQVDARLARRHDGSGLGLAVVDRLVALHGAQLELESETGRGSRFVVTLATAGSGS